MDLINGMFEMVGALLLILNCRRLYLDKCVKGISIFPALFFTAWGFWNVFYYPALGQWFSFAGGLCIVIVNAVWLSMTMYYLRKGETNGRNSSEASDGREVSGV
jgi:ABC-type transport system involved in cytochrome c biogenesis permease subunit